jgi:hypothetical protein
MGKDVKRISTPALNMLMAYHWSRTIPVRWLRPQAGFQINMARYARQ